MNPIVKEILNEYYESIKLKSAFLVNIFCYPFLLSKFPIKKQSITINQVLFVKELALNIFKFLYDDISTLYHSRLVSKQWNDTFYKLNWFKITSIHYPNLDEVISYQKSVKRGERPILMDWFHIFKINFKVSKKIELNKLYNTSFNFESRGRFYSILKRNFAKIKSLVTFPKVTNVWYFYPSYQLKPYKLKGNTLTLYFRSKKFTEEELMNIMKELSELYES